MTALGMSGGSQGLSSLAAALAPAGSSGYASPSSPMNMAGAAPMGAMGGVPGSMPPDQSQQGGDQHGDPNFPSTQPDVVTQILATLLQMQQDDHGTLMQAQQAALQANPLFQALMSGSPTSPGAGQTGQGIGPSGMVMPHSGYGA